MLTPDIASDLAAASIGQIAINVHDLERAVAFYRDALGLRFLFQPGPAMAFFDCGGVRLYLGKPERPEDDHLASVLYFKVPRSEEHTSELQSPCKLVCRLLLE